MKTVFSGAAGCVFLAGLLAGSDMALAQACVGDCSGDGQVAVDEMVTCIGVALGTGPLNACEACDANVDGAVQVGELVTTVGIGLGSVRSPACTQRSCLDSGGLEASGSCCIGAGDFPNTCNIGVCGCAPGSSEQVRMCECQPDRCFDGDRCVPLATRNCLDSGGTVSSASCCLATGDFPDTCAVGACGCSPESSHLVSVCECGPGKCFDGSACVSEAERSCTDSGGSVASRSCCSGVGDFPDTCAVGACGCSPDLSEPVLACDCPIDQCFDGTACVTR